VCPFSLVVLFPRLILTHACRSFVVIELGGGVAGRLFVTRRQHVDPCFHLSSSSRVGWEDGSRPPFSASDCRHLMLASLASVPTFRRLLVLLDASIVGSGYAGELLAPPDSCGRSWSPFRQKLFIIAVKSCLLLFNRLTLFRLWRWAV
jgi:hypothetical protein